LGTVIVVCGGVSLVGGILGEHKGAELFHGQAYFSQTVTPVLYILFLMSWVGVGAYFCIEKWKKGRKLRHGIAGACLITSLFLGLIGLYGLAQNSEPLTPFVMWGLLMVFVGFISYNANYIVGRLE
jgi:hypothetical protein